VTARRLVVKDPAGQVPAADARGRPLAHWEIDLTGMPNADAIAPLSAAVQEQCNLGCWHDVSGYPLQPWGTE
jgi:hypothetical protein